MVNRLWVRRGRRRGRRLGIGLSVAALGGSLLAAPMTAAVAVAPVDLRDDVRVVTYPSSVEVDRARAEVEERATTNSEMRAVLAHTARRVTAAHKQAGVAESRFTHAKVRVAIARHQAVQAKREATRARQRVEDQRVGIAMLVTQSYQNGSALDDITTFMTGGSSPAQVMQRYGVAHSAGQSMKLKYDAFADLSAEATAAEAKAARAERRTARIRAAAREDVDLAAAAVEAAQGASARNRSTAQELSTGLAEAREDAEKLVRDRKEALAAIDQQDQAPAGEPESPDATVHYVEAPVPPVVEEPEPETDRYGDPVDGLVVPLTYPLPVTDPPPFDRKAARTAIRFARAQLGEMYLWAAEGPDRWDCSGLTRKAWAAAGVELPHYSGAQYTTATPIRAIDAEPGDLVLWQDGGKRIHHVALYLGNGQILHARQTGEPVQVEDLDEMPPPEYFARP